MNLADISDATLCEIIKNCDSAEYKTYIAEILRKAGILT